MEKKTSAQYQKITQPILIILKDLAEKKYPVNVMREGEKQYHRFFLSTLPKNKSEPLFMTPCEEEFSRMSPWVLSPTIFSFSDLTTKFIFRSESMLNEVFQLKVMFPDAIYEVQRRQHYRVKIPETEKLVFSVSLYPQHEPFLFKTLDISEGGLRGVSTESLKQSQAERQKLFSKNTDVHVKLHFFFEEMLSAKVVDHTVIEKGFSAIRLQFHSLNPKVSDGLRKIITNLYHLYRLNQ